jgi:thioester reductase-like protein
VQILHNLISREQTKRVYCLIRAKDKAEAESRLDQALSSSKLTLPKSSRERAVALAGDLGRDKLGLDLDDYEALRSSVTRIIHNAWTVNFSMSLSSFEPQLAGTWQLIQLALNAPKIEGHPPELTFISSVAAVASADSLASSSSSSDPTQSKANIMELRYGWEAVGSLGYGQSKWVAEEICYAASEHAGLPLKVIRLGQISGDSHHGIWNPSEAVPTMVLSALTVGALPRVEAESVFRVGDAQLWIPSDIAAASIVELTLSKVEDDFHLRHHNVPSSETYEVSKHSKMPGTSETIPYVIFHVAGNHPASWNTDILPWLRNYGLFFEAVSQRDWVGKLASSDSDVSRNPPYKLLEFFKSNIQADNTLQVTSLERLPAQVYLDITQASKYAPSLAEAGRLDERLMRKYLDYWKKESWQKLERNLVVEGHDKEMGSG